MNTQPRFSYDYPHPSITTDIVVFTILDERLQLLLIRRRNEPFAGQWALPGGFLDIDEDLEQCAQRELREETGLSDLYLEQLYTFGQPTRDPRERVISVTYFALVPGDRLRPQAASDATSAAWTPYEEIPQLAFDHRDIVASAYKRLVAKLSYSTIAFRLLGETFTLSELQRVHEILLQESLDKRNFRKRVLALGIIEETGQLRRNGKHRPAREYRPTNTTGLEIIR